MTRRATALTSYLSFVTLTALLTGCEQQPQTASGGGTSTPSANKEAPKPATDDDATEPSQDELAALKEFVEEKGGEMLAGQNLPSGHPPIPGMTPQSSSSSGDNPSTNGAGAAIGELKYDPPESWESVPPASRMRKAQYRMPGDTGDGELTVFYFGPRGGGGTEANIQRWQGQFSGPEGGPVPEEDVTRETLESNGLKVTYLEVSGRFSPGAMTMGGQPQPPVDNYRLLAAVVETPQGPWFFKAAGPDETMVAHRAGFADFLKTFRFE